MNFGEKLTNLRKQKGLSQEELGEKLNVTRQTISKWELEQTSPDTNKLTEIANFFGVSVNDLTGEEDIKYTNSSLNNNEEEEKKSGVIVILIIILIGVLFAIAFLGTKAILKKKQEKEEKEKNRIEQINREKEKFEKHFEETNQFIKDQIENNSQNKTNNGNTRPKEEIQKEIDDLNKEVNKLREKQNEELKNSFAFTEEWYRLNNEISEKESQIMKLKTKLWKAEN